MYQKNRRCVSFSIFFNVFQWFGYFAPGNIDVILPMNETVLYKEDRIGLKSLHESGKIHFLSVVGDHLQIPEQTFVTEVIEKFLK